MHSFISVTCRNMQHYHTPLSAKPTAIDHMQRKMSQEAACNSSFINGLLVPQMQTHASHPPQKTSAAPWQLIAQTAEQEEEPSTPAATPQPGWCRKPATGRNQFSKGEILFDAAGPASDAALKASALQTLKHTCTSMHPFVHKITVALIILQNQCSIM